MSSRDRSEPFSTVCAERFVLASAERLWQIIASESGMRQWLGLCNFQPRLGGRVLLDTSGSNESDRIIVFGRVLEMQAERLISFSWAQLRNDRSVWPADTEVAVSLEASEGGCLARLTHSGFERLSAAQAEKAYSVYHHCWVQSSCMPRLGEMAGEA